MASLIVTAPRISRPLADQGELAQAGEEHIAIVDAIASGDGELAAQLMRQHLVHSRGIWAGRPEGATFNQ